MNEMAVILVVVLVTILLYGLYLSPWWARLLWPRVRYCTAPKQQAGAKLLELQVRHGLHVRANGWGSAYDDSILHTYYGVFKAEDGCQYTLVLTKEQYLNLFQGSTGILTRKGLWFIDFEAKDKKSDAIFIDQEY